MQQVALRLAFGGLLLFSAYNSLTDTEHFQLRDINQAIGFYSGQFDVVRQGRQMLGSNLDSLILNLLSMLALWAGIAIIGGFDRVGGALAMGHSVLALLFTSNVWTPKVDQD